MNDDLELVVDLAALRHNVRTLIEAIDPAEVMIVVKNDAYGHGLVDVARTAISAGVTWIGALDLPTALALRAAGVGEPTRIFAWLIDPLEDLGPALFASIDLGISNLDQLESISAVRSDVPARVHLKIDTGLHRNGANEDDWPALVSRAVELEGLGIVNVVAVWTHIAEADDNEDSLSISRFERAVAVARSLGVSEPLRHLAASAAGLARPDARFDLVRFGAFAYGLPPGHGPSAAEMGLRQVMTLRARVTTVQERADGCRYAAIAIGFADGLSTQAPGRATVAVGGVRRVLADPLEVDRAWIALDADDTVNVGDVATLWGEGTAGEASLQEWGDALGTMSEELVVRLSPRIPRRFV